MSAPLLALSAAVALSGCARHERESDDPDRIFGIAGDAEQREQMAALLPGLREGVEIHRVALVGGVRPLEEELDKYVSLDPGVEEEQLEALAAHGFMIALAPIEALDDILLAVPHDRVIDSTWMGQIRDWTALASSEWIEGTTFVDLAGESAPFSEGRFRLLTRAFTTPGPDGVGRRIRFEMVPQLHQPLADPFILDPSVENLSGQFIPGAAAAFALDGTKALLITAAAPSPPPTEVEPSESIEEIAEDDADDASPADRAPAGPRGARVRTVAEEILLAHGGQKRLLIIVTPRLEGVVDESSSSRNR